MGSYEITGKNVEEAIKNAVERFGIEREKLKYSVLKEGRAGVFGIGAEDAKILVEIGDDNKKNDANLITTVSEIIVNLLKIMGFTVTVEKAKPIVTEQEGEESSITFNIKGDDDVGMLIGRHGQTIASLQYLIRLMVSRRIDNPPAIIIDVDGYKQRRYESLKNTAKKLAEQVKNRKTPFTLEPMPAFERRIIHLTLANDPYVTTQSIGEGETRKVVIMPKNMGKVARKK